MAGKMMTVGMAVHDDFYGIWQTIQGLITYHRADDLIGEIIVVDNNPESPHGQMTRGFCERIGNPDGIVVKYMPFYGVKGTAAPRNAVFQLATSPVVVCCDPHVFFVPKAFKHLEFFFNNRPNCLDLIQGPMIYDNHQSLSTHFNLSQWDGEMWGRWDTDMQSYKAGKPFEIPAQGLGVFACRKEAWLGFNPKFRGFGGEEGYIHEKYRQAGRKTWCIPRFGWLHRFGRPEGVTYPLQRLDKVRNYVIGFQELNMDMTPAHAYWVGKGLVTQQQWDDIVAGKDVSAGPCCGAAADTGTKSLKEWFDQAATVPSDINEHVPTLRDLAKNCATVVEFGVRTGVSTAGLLAGRPGLLLSYDINDSAHARSLAKAAEKEGQRFEFYVGDSLQVDIPDEVDLLFIDTKHTGQHCYQELARHGKKAKRIAFHDTEIFGEKGEDGKEGLRFAIRHFLGENPEYSTIRHDNNNYGFTVISRVPEDQPPKLPSKWRMAANLFKSTVRDLKNGRARVPLEVAEERHKICTSYGGRCPVNQRRIDDDRCAGCGCYLKTDDPANAAITPKVFRPMDACPFGLWGNYKPDELEPETSEAGEPV